MISYNTNRIYSATRKEISESVARLMASGKIAASVAIREISGLKKMSFEHPCSDFHRDYCDSCPWKGGAQ